MAFEQTRDIIHHLRAFHHELSLLYMDLEHRTSREQVTSLLGLLIRHEAAMEERLVRYEEQVSDYVLDTYFKYRPESSPLSCIREYRIHAEIGLVEVVVAANYFDACLISFCKEMAERSMCSKVRELFENLLAMERSEQLELSKRTLCISAA